MQPTVETPIVPDVASQVVTDAAYKRATATKTPAVISDTTIRDSVIPAIKNKATTLLPQTQPQNGLITSQNPQGTPVQGTVVQNNNTLTNNAYKDDYASALAELGIDSNESAISPEQQQIFDMQSRANDDASRQALATINRRYDQKNQLLQTQQRNQGESTSSALMNAGGKYDPFGTGSIMSQVTSGQLQQFNDLQDEEQNLIGQANQAKSAADYKILGEKLDLIQKKKDQKMALATKIADTMHQDNKDLQEKQAADAKELRTSKDNLLLQLTKNNAPQEVKDAVRGATTYSDAINASEGHLLSPEDKLDMQYKKAQISKIYSDIQHDRATEAAASSAGVEPSQLMAYASQYASTGKIPTGLPKGTFGAISQVAKELPKQPGELIDATTGVRPDANDTTTNAYSALYSAIELSKQLKELDDKRWGGVIGGVTAAIKPSQTQQEYSDLRSQIVDLLARARSGAALTASEERRYTDMLPGNFSQPLFLGADSSVKLDNFTNNLSSDLRNKASSNGWAVNGISKVKLGGTDYTVGDVITNAQGQKGRVNADGSITQIQ